MLVSLIIPNARSMREVSVKVPLVPSTTEPNDDSSSNMEVDTVAAPTTETHVAQIASEGLLLYVSQAAYEPGTSPLSSWIPIASSGDAVGGDILQPINETGAMDVFEE
jgi:snurportin-1